jgi:phosphoribosylanthranilate isomerase
MRLLVKTCGITSREDADAAIAAGVDLLGFVFVPGTPRAMDPEEANWVVDIAGAETVGVFRDTPLERILAIRDGLRLDRVQLHGDEPDSYLETLGSTTIRRVCPREGVDWRFLAELGRRSLPLLDPGAGDGVAWSWRTLAPPTAGFRFGLAGGLTPDTVAEAVALLSPVLVDVSSGVERAPGIKDAAKIADFVRNARGADQRRDGG